MNPVTEEYVSCHDLTSESALQIHYTMLCFGKFLGRQPTISDFADLTVNRFIMWMASQGYAIETIRSRRRMLLTLWKHLAEQGMAAPPRKVRSVGPSHDVIRAWTKEQIKAILRECEKMTGRFRANRSVDRGVFLTAFCRTAYETGLRRSDVLRIRYSWIQKSGLIALVQSKTGRPHLVRLRQPTIDLIGQIDRTGRETVFGGLVSNRYLSHLLDKVFTRAGIPEGSLKWFRRSGATHVEIDHPGAGWKFLGHTTPRVAEQSYLDKLQIGEDPLAPPEI